MPTAHVSSSRSSGRGARALSIAWLTLAAASTSATIAPSIARADEDPAAAEALFQEARKLSDAGNYKDACPKFLASQKAGPGIGTLLNLAACYEKLGMTASAWARYREAQSFAQRANRPDREKTAKERAQKLEPRLPRLIVTAKEGAPSDVKRDDTPIDEGALGTPVPVDPGSHTITARAPGKKTWTKTVTLAESQTETVVVPPLDDDAGGAKPEEHTETTPTDSAPLVATEKSSGMRTASYFVMGGGLVAIGVGSYFGAQTFSTWSDAKKHCQGSACDATGVKLAGDAKNDGTISTALVIGGGALAAVGLVLFIVSPSSSSSSSSGSGGHAPLLVPAVSPTFAGLSLSGAL